MSSYAPGDTAHATEYRVIIQERLVIKKKCIIIVVVVFVFSSDQSIIGNVGHYYLVRNIIPITVHLVVHNMPIVILGQSYYIDGQYLTKFNVSVYVHIVMYIP